MATIFLGVIEIAGSELDAPRPVWRQQAQLRLLRQDRFIAITALCAALLAFPMGRALHGPEAAATLLLAALALSSGQRWALGLVAISQIMLISACVSQLRLDALPWPAQLQNCIVLALSVPGLLALRRAAATLVVLTNVRRTSYHCRLMYLALLVFAAIAVLGGAM
jgi:hypothetical protein